MFKRVKESVREREREREIEKERERERERASLTISMISVCTLSSAYISSHTHSALDDVCHICPCMSYMSSTLSSDMMYVIYVHLTLDVAG